MSEATRVAAGTRTSGENAASGLSRIPWSATSQPGRQRTRGSQSKRWVPLHGLRRRRLGERFDKAVKAAVNLVAAFPDLGSPYFFGTRCVFPKKFHFSIVYLALGQELFIVAIAPESRKPGYWRSRTGDPLLAGLVAARGGRPNIRSAFISMHRLFPTPALLAKTGRRGATFHAAPLSRHAPENRPAAGLALGRARGLPLRPY